ncbi:MAG: CGP-CTERM sorting domain-containing protein, partial [Thermococcus sp.]
VGLKVEVDKAGDYWDKWGAGSWDMAIVGFVPHKPTDLIWFTSNNPGNRVGFSDKTYDELFQKFQTTGDPTLAHKLEEILANKVVFIALYHPIVATPYRVDRYKDWSPNPRFLTLGYWSLLGKPVKPTPTLTTSSTSSPTPKPSTSSTTSSPKTSPTSSEGEKGICGPAALVLLAVLPLLRRRR